MPNYHSAYYEVATGKIVSTTVSDFDLGFSSETPFPGILRARCAEAISGDTAYIQHGNVVPRPLFPAVADKVRLKADGVDTVTVRNIPDPCTITINDREVLVDSATMTLRSAAERVFTLKATVWPYQDWTLQIEAVA